MQLPASDPWWKGCRWTLGLCAAMTVANLGLFCQAPDAFAQLIDGLQFDRQAIFEGQVWRLVTGNLVHWSSEHFFLDVVPFLIVGLLYERCFQRHYPWILLTSALAVGGGVLLFAPEMGTYRGLSGVDSGQFAAVLGLEFWLAVRQPRRWAWVAPAAAIFILKILYECGSGEMFFGTESLGDIGVPLPVAHAAGTLGAVAFLLIAARRVSRCPQFAPVSGRLTEGGSSG
jgi:rhomboid family GlyGly-CTERM serine protease